MNNELKLQIALNKQKALNIKAQKKIRVLTEENEKLKKEISLLKEDHMCNSEEEGSFDGYISPDYESGINGWKSDL